jgi:hypothetical protein
MADDLAYPLSKDVSHQGDGKNNSPEEEEME